MATIVIKDLAESVDLDHQAMVAITGGSRIRGRQLRQPFPAQSIQRSTRIVNYPRGFGIISTRESSTQLNAPTK